MFLNKPTATPMACCCCCEGLERFLTCKVGSHGMDDLGTWQLASVSHQAVANLHSTPGQCSSFSTAHGLKVGPSCCRDVRCYTAGVQQLAVCSIDNSPTGMLGNVLLVHLHSTIACQAHSLPGTQRSYPCLVVLPCAPQHAPHHHKASRS